MVSALDRKLLRDLWAIKGQALAIALVIASGISAFIMSLSTLDSLTRTRSDYYVNYRFADAFASLKRAPNHAAHRLATIPGVTAVATRVAASARLEVTGFNQPITGLILSLPDFGASKLNAVYLRQGRMPNPARNDEVLVSEMFVQAHGLQVGDTIIAVVNGRRQTLHIAGIALSPEHIYQIAPGSLFPDFTRYGILWMPRSRLAAAYNMEGAFNDVVFSLDPHANEEGVLEAIDRALAQYGGVGAYGREYQMSHRFLNEEFRQLSEMAKTFPVIFLGVAAFLLNVVTNRIVGAQREQIAALKAFGYGRWQIGLHYFKLVLLVTALGIVLGTLWGAWFGQNLSELYMQFYRFPYLIYELRPQIFFQAVSISALAAAVGAFLAVRKAVNLPPAEAMQPEPPANYRRSILEQLGIGWLFSQPARMILRNLERRPWKSLLSVLGISLACAVMIMGTFMTDAFDFMIQTQFAFAQREDIAVTFVDPVSQRAQASLAGIAGIQRVEVYRSVPAKLRFGHRSYRTSVQGIAPGGDLARLLNMDLQPFEPPQHGIVLTDYLGDILDVQAGDFIEIEVLEESRPTLHVQVVGLVKQYMGISAYMSLTTLNRMMKEGHTISGAYLAVDEARTAQVIDHLNTMPKVAGATMQRHALESFIATMGQQTYIFTGFMAIFAGTIAFGVVYNSARIALAERARELASLRVLGFTRGEISYILLGELALLTALAIPLGFAIGYVLCFYMVGNLQNELFRVPMIIAPHTYALAAAVVLTAATVSSLIVRQRLDHLDLVAVLKTKE